MCDQAQRQSIDVNSDMGEGFGIYAVADDTAILRHVTSANVACGYHAGDPEVMASVFRMAKDAGVAVGAHPGFPDLWGFGRRRIPFSPGEIERLVAYQIGAAQALAQYAGHRITYVKPHGSLGNLTESEPEIAWAVTNAVRAVDPTLVCLTIAHGCQDRLAREIGMTVKSEICGDRAYTDTGRLVPRSQPGAVIADPAIAAARAVRMVSTQAIETVTGDAIPTIIDSVCVHSDTPNAVPILECLRSALQDAGISTAAFSNSELVRGHTT